MLVILFGGVAASAVLSGVGGRGQVTCRSAGRSYTRTEFDWCAPHNKTQLAGLWHARRHNIPKTHRASADRHRVRCRTHSSIEGEPPPACAHLRSPRATQLTATASSCLSSARAHPTPQRASSASTGDREQEARQREAPLARCAAPPTAPGMSYQPAPAGVSHTRGMLFLRNTDDLPPSTHAHACPPSHRQRPQPRWRSPRSRSSASRTWWSA